MTAAFLLLVLAAAPDSLALRIAGIVEKNYADAATGARMAARLRERLPSYAALDEAAVAAAIDRDLRAVANDQHMMLMYSAEPLSPTLGRNESIVDPPADPEDARRRNAGVTRVERLAGNVGYLAIERFYPPQQSAETLAAAMNAIQSTDALIVDLRGNIGGHPGTVAFFCSYFFEKRTHLNDIVDRQHGRTTSFWTDPNVPGKRYLGKPVFVLVSAESFSAAEEVAYDLQTLRRATIVGKTTAGAANPAIAIRLSDHLVFYLPTGRAVNPVTKTNWEGVGVKPDVEVDAAAALERAHALALAALGRDTH